MPRIEGRYSVPNDTDLVTVHPFCTVCGASVMVDNFTLHNEFHDGLNEVADKVWRAGLE